MLLSKIKYKQARKSKPTSLPSQRTSYPRIHNKVGGLKATSLAPRKQKGDIIEIGRKVLHL